MEMFSLTFWVAIQLVIDLVLVILVVFLLRYLKLGTTGSEPQQTGEALVRLFEPLLTEAKDTAKDFEQQLDEKRRLIQHLNETIDSRIISLNLLLHRAEGSDSKGSSTPSASMDTHRKHRHVYDQQKAIIDLFEKGCDADTTAKRLSIPKNEVEMVYDLKQKFLRMEQHPGSPEHG
jgi:hypothetical protein